MSHTGTASHVTVYSKATQQTFALGEEHSDVKKKKRLIREIVAAVIAPSLAGPFNN